MESIYADIAARTGGNIYIGVVGPVRTGKSTLVKRFMETLIIPELSDPFRVERARDELPQCGSGKTIMTSEPKFVPEEAVEISPDGVTKLRVRLIDSVGYLIPGAIGAEEDGSPRMVTTPWFDREIPMTQAAELGTKKVMEGHATLGLVVTTDGTVTDIPREDYADAECRAIRDMKATGKPFLVVVNTREPQGQRARELRKRLMEEEDCAAVVMECQATDKEGIGELLGALLYTFPMTQLRMILPRWMDALEPEHPVKKELCEKLLSLAENIHSLGQAERVLPELKELDQVTDFTLRTLDPATGWVVCALTFPERLFYEVLSARAGMPIEGDAQLLSLLTELARVKREYDRLSDALNAVKATGYGVVMPGAEDMKLEKPEMLKKNGTYGVRLKAGAPSIHMLRVDIDTEIAPMVGDEQQSKDLISFLQGEDPEKLWRSNIFGKSVYELIQEGLNAKLVRLPEDVRSKFRGTLTKIVNEGATGLVCLIL